MTRSLAFVLLTCGACSTAPPLPPQAAWHNQAGAEALAEGDLERADARLTLALEYSPDFVEALTNLGLVEIRRGNFDRAEQLLERSKRLNPDVAQTHHGLGVLEERRHQRASAADHYRAALAVDPGFVEARANLARLLFEAGKFEHALVEYRLLMEAAPERSEGLLGLASTLISIERLDESRALLSQGVERFGERPEFSLVAGRWLLRRGDPEGALATLRPLAESVGLHTVPALGWMAVAELAQARPFRAIAAARRALDLEPDDPLATYALALALHDVNDPSALAWLERALRSNPGHPELVARIQRQRSRVGSARP